MGDLCLANGRWVEGIDPADRAFNFGDGLFETMLSYQGAVPLWSMHRARLQRDCMRLRIPLQLSAVDAQLEQFLAGLWPGSDASRVIVKLLVSRGSGGMGYAPAGCSDPTLVWRARPWTAPAGESEGVRLVAATTPLVSHPSLAGIKLISRMDYVMAAVLAGELPADCELLLSDERACVVESLHHNLFALSRGRLLTPLLDRCGVSGVMRSLIISEIAPALGIAVDERRMSLRDLQAAEEVFLCNSVRGLTSVREVVGVSVASTMLTGEFRKALQARIGESYAV